MIVIADSGSSKTDWMFIKDTGSFGIQSPGINPFYQDATEILNAQKVYFKREENKAVSLVYFYGAGCIKDKSDKPVIDALTVLFPSAEVLVEDDMLGAARAVLGNNEGIACILGTGANSCYYNGQKISDKIPPLGFILGDEGSGAHIGKLFMNDYFKRALPKDFKEKAEKELALDLPDVLTAVYRKEYPSRYLAAFSRFLAENKTHVYTYSLVKKSFGEFFFRNIERYAHYQDLAVSFVGAIAFNYSEILKEVAFERGITIGKIISKPIDGLKCYHTDF